MSLLRAEHLTVQFGGLVAVKDVSFSVEPGQIFCIIGPNGAGKTTLFNLFSRIYAPSAGRMLLDGVDFTTLPPHRIAQLGIARTFQNLELFDHATVLENLLVGRHRFRRHGFLDEIWFDQAVWQAELESRQAVENIIDFLDLHRFRDTRVGALPYGVRKVIELGRALCSQPRLLLLDEPSSGLNAEESEDIGYWILDIKRHFGITVLMIEHDMRLMGQVSDRVLALNEGSVLTEGSVQEVQSHPQVIEAYLGVQA